MSSKNRKLQYSLAINESLHQLMESDESVFIIGQGVKSPWYVGNTCRGLLEKFGSERVIDTPVSENAVTGAAVGAAIAGMKPIVVHPRMDFMLFAMDPIINQAANWHYMFGGKLNVPVVIWGIINRGGEQAAQHSQALHNFFVHVPGLKVVMPSTPYDAKGLMISAVQDPNPVVYIDDRWLYRIEGVVPENTYSVPIGKGVIRKTGKDITIISISYMVLESLKAADHLGREHNIDAEVIDLRSLKPYDTEIILQSIKKTGKVVIADVGWKTGGFSAEILAFISENLFDYLHSPPRRVALPDAPAPANRVLEEAYYPNYRDIMEAVMKVMKK
ncbi:pyruvate dehydrogenase complex E1 component subunit beta [Thermodesulfovibrio sp. 3462-1]|uniref:Pyruvate dehydrogenase complex E1 component subunit beta n=1 Tax=Thermodesulfovibrio obliviosus TaxID=3118332 RepID=A0AAU8H2N3_9BACT